MTILDRLKIELTYFENAARHFSYTPRVLAATINPDVIINNYLLPWTLAKWLEFSPMAQETWVQSQVESYQRLKNGTWFHLA